MPNQIGDPTHLQIVEWVVGTIVVIGGAMLAIFGKLLKGKQGKEPCGLIHQGVSKDLLEIKERLDKGTDKMDGMKLTLTEIATTLRVRSEDETKRYERHTEGWKDK